MNEINYNSAKVGMKVCSNKNAYIDYKKAYGVITNISVYGVITVKSNIGIIRVYANTLNFAPISVIR